MKDVFELHPDRLGTADEEGRRVFVYPADVRGKWRGYRMKLRFILVMIFLMLPWVRWNGRQWLLLDISHRRFEIFGLSLRAHDAPALVLVLATFGFGLFFVTAAWGRVWCGWACPQTVFIEEVFRRIERWIEGPALERKKLDQGPWTARKARLKSVKWALYTLAAAVITHSFLAYFVGSAELAKMVQADPREHWGSFLFILTTTGLILFNFAWFREQLCIIVCPYGRFQSLSMDAGTMVVGYDAKRGEPRRMRGAPKEEPAGDCVNCYRCVQVCPTGIDIRRGTQMECISCTACMDACDEVMTKTRKPTGLIRYTSEDELKGRVPRLFRARTMALAAAFVLSVASLIAFAILHEPMEIVWFKAKGAPYEVIKSDGLEDVVVNRFQLELSNQSESARDIRVLPSEKARPGLNVVLAINPVRVEAGRLQRADVFIRLPRSAFVGGKSVVSIATEDLSDGTRSEKELTLVGPF